jgi:peptide/nickel transport system substrate-binding protein
LSVSGNSPALFTRRRVLGTSLAAVAAVVLEGCAKAAGSASSGSPGQKSVTIGVSADVLLDQIMRQQGNNRVFMALVYDSLVNLDLSTEQPQPSLATSWQWNADQTTLTVNLRDDVKYHTGRAFGPDDVIFSMKQVQNPNSGAQTGPIAQKITSMTASGPHQVTFVLSEPLSNFFDLLALTPMVDSQTFSDIASGEKLVGTGPFTWNNWTPGTSLSLGKNKHYWQPGKPLIDSIQVRIYSSSQAMLAAAQSGEITMAYRIVPSEAATMATGSFRMYSSAPQFTDWYVGVDVTAPPFTDIRARQAVAYALDRERITSQVFGRYGQPSSVPWSVTSPGLSAADSTYYTYDPAKAKQLFAAAGSPKTPIPLFTDSGDSTLTAIFDIVQNNLESVGFNVTSRSLDATTYSTQNQDASFNGLWIGTVDMVSVSIGTCVLGNAPLKVSKNTSHVTDPTYKSLANKLITATSAADIASANRNITDYLLEQAFHLTVTHGNYVGAAQKSFTGVTHNVITDLVVTSATVS